MSIWQGVFRVLFSLWSIGWVWVIIEDLRHANWNTKLIIATLLFGGCFMTAPWAFYYMMWIG